MATTDIYVQSTLLSESSYEMLAGCGKAILSSLNITHTTQLFKTNRGYDLLVNEQRVRVELNKGQYTEEAVQAPSLQLIIISERLDLIKDRLALSITQLAELFGVTRKTVYDWYEGTEPRRNAINRIETLIEALNRYSELDLTRLKSMWSIPVSGKSFRAVLNDENLDAETLQNTLAKKLDELSTRMVATTSTMQKTTSQLGDAQLAEFDRRTEHG